MSIFAVIATLAALALVGCRLAVSAGNLGLHLSEYLLADNALVVIFNVILRELPGVFLMYTRQHILGKGLLQQHIPAVFFIYPVHGILEPFFSSAESSTTFVPFSMAMLRDCSSRCVHTSRS